MLLLSFSRLSVGEVKRSRAKEWKKKKKKNRTAGNKNSRPGLSYNNILLLDSITSPKTQVLLSYFLCLSISRPFSLHHLFATSECSLSLSLSSSCCSQSISHSLSFTLHSGPPAATNMASLIFSTCLLSDLHFLCDNPVLFISRSFFLCLNLPPARASRCESLFVTSLVPPREAPACALLLVFIPVALPLFRPLLSICLRLSFSHLTVTGFRSTSTVKWYRSAPPLSHLCYKQRLD